MSNSIGRNRSGRNLASGARGPAAWRPTSGGTGQGRGRLAPGSGALGRSVLRRARRGNAATASARAPARASSPNTRPSSRCPCSDAGPNRAEVAADRAAPAPSSSAAAVRSLEPRPPPRPYRSAERRSHVPDGGMRSRSTHPPTPFHVVESTPSSAMSSFRRRGPSASSARTRPATATISRSEIWRRVRSHHAWLSSRMPAARASSRARKRGGSCRASASPARPSVARARGSVARARRRPGASTSRCRRTERICHWT